MKRMIAVAILVGLGLVGGPFLSARFDHGRAATSAASLVFPPYPAQKVVYHVTESDGLLHRRYFLSTLHSVRNHVNAVARGALDLRIVLQGDGVDMLKAATSDADLAGVIDALKAAGVRILVCRNTLVSRGIDPGDLYHLETADIVAAGVAEVTSLQMQGFAYLKL